MLDFLYTYLCSLISGLAIYYVGYSLCGASKKFFKLRSMILLMVLALLIMVLYDFVDMNLRIPLCYYLFTVFFLCVFKNSTTNTMVTSLISYVIIIISDFPILLGYIALNWLTGNMVSFINETLVANILVLLITMGIIKIFKKQLRFLYNKLCNTKKIDIIILAPTFFIAVGTIFFKAGNSGWMYDDTLWLNLLLVVTFTSITIYLLKEKMNNVMMRENYKELGKYVKNSEQLIEEYRITQHENKNQLVVIKTMVRPKNTKLLEYLDHIIKDKYTIKYKWITSLKNIPLDCAKGLIHFKLLRMEELGISIDINISKELQNSLLKDFPVKDWDSLNKIIGVFLDNAIEATATSKEKKFIMDAYLEDDTVVFEFANTFNEINQVDDGFVSTKDKTRGHGLILVKRIIRSFKIYSNETSIRNGYFIQVLKIKKTTD